MGRQARVESGTRRSELGRRTRRRDVGESAARRDPPQRGTRTLERERSDRRCSRGRIARASPVHSSATEAARVIAAPSMKRWVARATSAAGLVALALVLVALLPHPAYAWTPGTHVFLGQAVMRSLTLIPQSVAELLH